MNKDTPLTISALAAPFLDQPPNPATVALEEQLREAAKRGLTPRERRSQEIGWILGGMPPGSITREELEEEFDRKYGKVWD